MDLDLSQDELAFRDEVRRFIAGALAPELAKKVEEQRILSKDDHLVWQRALHKRGWAAPHWPRAHGGAGFTPIQRYIFQQECALAYAPRLIPFGLVMVGPVLIEFGSAEQKAKYLPRILASEEWWCQGYSEPESGSDLASLRTRAERDGDHYVLQGTKTWTTLAQYADRMFCLARTGAAGGKKQEGISFFLIDMRAPGVTVRPIVTFDGKHEINEVRLDGVRVPAEDRVGEDGAGWTIAKFLLGNERVGIAQVAASKAQLARLKRIMAAEKLDSPIFRDRVAQLEIELRALEITELRIVTAEQQGRAPGPEASLLKIKGTEIAQAITELLLEAVGYDALPDRWRMPEHARQEGGGNLPPLGPDYAHSVAPYYFNWRKTSIYGGSNEIQRNIIAKAVLGL